MEDVTLTPVLIGGAAGTLVSVLLFIAAIFSPRVDNIPDNVKQGLNVLGIVVVTAFIAGLSCYTQIVFIECTQLGLWELVVMAMSAIVANASTYQSFNKVADATKAHVR